MKELAKWHLLKHRHFSVPFRITHKEREKKRHFSSKRERERERERERKRENASTIKSYDD